MRDDWTTYGHDVRRTSASLGSVTGPLSLSWSYVPQGTSGHALSSVVSAIGTVDGIFVRTSLAAHFGYGVSPAMDRVSPTGQHVWTFNVGSDADFGDWASLMGNRVIINSDGTRFVDQTSGLSVHSNGVDTWGEILTRLEHALLRERCADRRAGRVRRGVRHRIQGALDRQQVPELPRLGVGNGGRPRAQQRRAVLRAGLQRGTAGDNTAVRLRRVRIQRGDGREDRRITRARHIGRISADDSHVYLIENLHTLVALAQSDLHVVWSATIANPGEQAPVHGERARDRRRRLPGSRHTTRRRGAKSWSSAALNGVATHWYGGTQGGNCGYVQIPTAYGATASIAAALGSRTLVVTASDGIHILALATGADLWNGRPAGVSGTVGIR